MGWLIVRYATGIGILGIKHYISQPKNKGLSWREVKGPINKSRIHNLPAALKGKCVCSSRLEGVYMLLEEQVCMFSELARCVY